MNRIRELLLGLATLISFAAAHGDTALYPTGPSQDSALIRFVNALDSPLDVLPEGEQTPSTLAPSVVSVFSAVPADKPVTGALSSAGVSVPVKLNLVPGEFVTFVVLPGDKGFELLTVREQPKDFNGLQASLALINADPDCTGGGLRRAGRQEQPIFHDLNPGLLERRDVNPVKLSVQGFCDGTLVTAPLSLGPLESGERYTVLILSQNGKPVLVFVKDIFAQ
ncbi:MULTISPECIES: alginate O-acetyltransferase AlgF [Pseudomonas]|uniref:alginate O-acetyltransferase AlgF n=1 Tax=Pseudomonas TaxID=286 RepID=UPI000CD53E38|nr:MULTISPECIES: alginate O-acetyltransferase AlgF [Pseudomonas]RBH58306.1 cell division protein FtsQ [Pseudomonas sp. MWU13-2860]